MVIKQFLKYSFILISTLGLFACQQIEHRSEAIPKAPLPMLAEKKTSPAKLVWSNNKSKGVNKSDAKLKVAIGGSEVVVADNSGQLMALDKNTGAVKWQVQSKAPISAGPAIIQGRVLVGTREGHVIAYQLSNGASLWQARVSGSVLAAPTGGKGIIYVHVLDGSVVALKADNGHQLWRHAVFTPPLMLRQNSSPVLSANRLLVGFANGKLIAFDYNEGVPLWEREVAVSKGRSDIQRMVDISSDPVVYDNKVYVVSYQGRMMAFDVESGESVWEKDLSSYSGVAVTKAALYASDSSGVIWALNRNSGKELWKGNELRGRHLTQPTVLNNTILVGDEDGYLHWLSKKDGSYLGRVLVDSKGIDSAPVVKDNIVYVLGRGGKLAAFSAFPAEAVTGEN